jgi:predicted dienelactone hydrolase
MDGLTFLTFPQWSASLALGGLSLALASLPVRSAEKIYLDYKIFDRVIPVSSLETFVEDGTIDAELQPYAGRFTPEAQQEFRKVLGEPLQDASPDLPEKLYSPFVLSQWLYSSIGERSLRFLGNFLQTAGRSNGERAIRGAMILAAADPDGLSLINFLKYFPTEGIRLDFDRILTLVNDIKAEAAETDHIITEIKQLSETSAAAESALDYAGLPDLSQTGPYAVVKQTVLLQDTSRKGLWGAEYRTFPVDLYQPANLNAVPGPIPVLVLSHGYASSRAFYADAAPRLAANGFVVAVPEHIGSDAAYRNAMEAGLTNESFQPMEFVNRPLDISFVLDELERKNTTDFQGRLQLDRVGVFGHSFGGYTVLAIAGATVDLEKLQQRCAPDAQIPGTLSTAFLLECQVLALSDSPDMIRQLTDGSLRDSRVQMVMAFAPVSNLFGKTGMSKIQIPVVLAGGVYDIAAPVVPEQVEPFGWLTTSEKYFYLAENTSHTANLTRITEKLFHPGVETAKSVDESIQWFRGAIETLVVAYGRVYLLDQDDYRPYLTSAYIEAASREPQKLHLVSSLPEDLAP